MQPCPCGTKQTFDECCGVFLSGKKFPSTPEQLMRSRYTAYCQANVDYIEATMKSPASDHFDKGSAKQWAKQVQWLGLEVLQSYMEKDTGFVEFIATFKQNQANQRLHELSTFHHIDGRWFYVDGKLYE